MIRKDLLNALNLVGPALESYGLIPILTNFCFDGETVTAYDSIVGIQAVCDAPINGALPGKVLLDWLNTSLVKELDISTKDNKTTFKTKARKLTLPTLPEEDFLFEIPELDDPIGFNILDDKFIGAIKLCLPILQQQKVTNILPLMGITLVLDKDIIDIYSSSGLSLCHYHLTDQAVSKNTKESFILGPEFCKAFYQTYRKLEVTGCYIAMDAKSVVACIKTKDNNDVTLFGGLVNATPMDFETEIEQSIDLDNLNYIPIPDRLGAALQGASAIMKFPDYAAEVEITGNKMKLVITTEIGETRDLIKIDKGHGDIKATCNPGIMQQAISNCSDMCITENHMILRDGDSFIHILANKH